MAAESKAFKTVSAPPHKEIGQPFEEIPLPERRWYQWINDVFTRLDELGEAHLRALNVLIEQNNLALSLLSVIAGVEVPGVEIPGVEIYRDYMTEDQLDNKDAVSAATPVEIEVLELMGRRAKYGYVYSETGTLNVKINDRAPIPLKVADFLSLADLHLEVEKLRIDTESVSAITFRLLLV